MTEKKKGPEEEAQNELEERDGDTQIVHSGDLFPLEDEDGIGTTTAEMDRDDLKIDGLEDDRDRTMIDEVSPFAKEGDEPSVVTSEVTATTEEPTAAAEKTKERTVASTRPRVGGSAEIKMEIRGGVLVIVEDVLPQREEPTMASTPKNLDPARNEPTAVGITPEKDELPHGKTASKSDIHNSITDNVGMPVAKAWGDGPIPTIGTTSSPDTDVVTAKTSGILAQPNAGKKSAAGSAGEESPEGSVIEDVGRDTTAPRRFPSPTRTRSLARKEEPIVTSRVPVLSAARNAIKTIAIALLERLPVIGDFIRKQRAALDAEVRAESLKILAGIGFIAEVKRLIIEETVNWPEAFGTIVDAGKSIPKDGGGIERKTAVLVNTPVVSRLIEKMWVNLRKKIKPDAKSDFIVDSDHKKTAQIPLNTLELKITAIASDLPNGEKPPSELTLLFERDEEGDINLVQVILPAKKSGEKK